jgi:hypothetical protein
MNLMPNMFVALALAALPSSATAGAPPPVSPVAVADHPPDGPRPLPPSQSDNDPAPPVPTPAPPVEQAGIGGVIAYGRAGVVELGGSISLDVASDYFRVSAQPSFGWFGVDMLEISALLGFSYLSITAPNASGVKVTTSQTLFSLLAEPSLHIPFTESVFGFLGVGLGLSYAENAGAGFALQPRLGVNVMVGRSGILTPAIYVAWSTHSAIQTKDGLLLGQTFGYGLNIGYTVMW